MKKRYRRGDWSPDGEKRFWAYTHGTEGWMDAARFEEAKERTSYWLQVAASNRNLLEQLRQEHFEKTKPKPRNKPKHRK